MADQTDPIGKEIDAYKAVAPQVEIETTFAPVDTVNTAIRTQLNGGGAPDIHVAYPGSANTMSVLNLAEAGLMTDLTSEPWASYYPESLKGVVGLDGKVHMYSAGFSALGVVYNRDVFEEVGVTIPTTRTEFFAVCEQLKAAGKVPLVIGAQDSWPTLMIPLATVATTVYGVTPDFDDQQLARQASFSSSPGWQAAIGFYQELLDKGYINASPNGTTFVQQTTLVGTGEVAMAPQVGEVLPNFRESARSDDVISMFPFPPTDAPDDFLMPTAPSVGLGVHARGPNEAAAIDFLRFLGSQEGINIWATSIVPIKRDANSTIDSAIESFLPYFDAGRVAAYAGLRWPNAEVQPTMMSSIQRLFSGELDVNGVLKAMDDAYAKQ